MSECRHEFDIKWKREKKLGRPILPPAAFCLRAGIVEKGRRLRGENERMLS